MTRRVDISKNVKFAIVDVLTQGLNAEISRIRKSGKRVHIQLSAYIQDQDWSSWDGVSIEQGVDVIKCTIKPVAAAVSYRNMKG